jgi:hypothetical protein
MGGASEVLKDAFEFSGIRISLNIPTNKQYGSTSLTLQAGSHVRFVRSADAPWQQLGLHNFSDMDGFLQVVDVVNPTFGNTCPTNLTLPTVSEANFANAS